MKFDIKFKFDLKLLEEPERNFIFTRQPDLWLPEAALQYKAVHIEFSASENLLSELQDLEQLRSVSEFKSRDEIDRIFASHFREKK